MRESTRWTPGTLADAIAALDAGVSVNSEDRPHGAGEIGILKTSALNSGVFQPAEHKTVLRAERARVAEPVQADSILVSRMNTPALVGEACYVEDAWPELFVPDRIWQLKPKDRDALSLRWLSYVLRSTSARAHIDTHATGTSGSMKNLPKSGLLSLPVAYPPLSEQVAVASVLDTLDTTIRHTEAIIEKLKQVKRGLLHDLLTRGIDANGELRPPQNDAPHLYKASPLGWIPKSWTVGGVLDVAPSDRQCILTGPFGAQLGQEDFVSEGVPVLRIGNVQAGFLDWTDTQFIKPAKAAQLERFRVQEGDLLFARQGATTGRNALADRLANGALINYHIIRVAVDEQRCHPQYLYALFNSDRSRGQVDQEKGRGTREGINSQQIAALRFALPEIAEQQAAVARMMAVTSALDRESDLAAKLRLQKVGLMDDLLTGRVRVTALLPRTPG